jgi:hypothetical protein
MTVEEDSELSEDSLIKDEAEDEDNKLCEETTIGDDSLDEATSLTVDDDTATTEEL